VRDWPAANEAFQSGARDQKPEFVEAKIPLACCKYIETRTSSPKRDLSQIPAGIDPDGEVSEARWNLCMLQRDFTAADEVADKIPQTDFWARAI